MDPKTGQLLREHLRARRGGRRITEQDRPKQTPSSTEALLRRAHLAGGSIGTLCEQIHRNDGELEMRRILGVLSLGRKHGVSAVEDAADVAPEVNAPTHRFLSRYRKRRPPAPLSLRQVDPLIRQLNLYRDLIDQRTGDPT